MADVNASNASPIKTFLRRHSPIKSRNKPLPAAPPSRDASPTRRPLNQADANAPIRTSSEQAAKSTRQRISSIFRSSEKASDASRAACTANPAPAKQAHHHHSQSVPGTSTRARHTTTDDQRLYERLESPPSIRRLSAKVNSLEAQLQEAQRQLSAYAQVQESGVKPRHRSHGARDRSVSAQTSEEHTRRRSSYVHDSATDRFDGVVESLLQSSIRSRDDMTNFSRPSHARRSSNPSSTSTVSRRASADIELAYQRYKERQAEKEAEGRVHTPDELDRTKPTSSPISGEDTPQRQKRKRSELRESSWRKIQEYQSRENLAKEWDRRAGDRKSNGYYEPRRSVSESAEPPAQRPKHKHEDSRHSSAVRDKSLPPEPKSPSPSPRRHRRSASQTENELPREQRVSQIPRPVDTSNAPPSPNRRFATSPTKLMPVKEEFEWDEDVF